MTRFLGGLIEGRDRPLAKVCGLTRQADVESSVRAGADLLGLVSCPSSPRHLSDLDSIALGRAIEELGGRSVLVMVDAHRVDVEKLVREAHLDAVQLCGAEDPADWRETSYGLLRRIGVDEQGHGELRAWRGIADAFVLDHPSSSGGSGQAVDLDLAARLAREAPCFLAGGLDASAAVFQKPPSSAPFCGFDASSRLESAPGRKDREPVRSFVDAAHRYPHLPGDQG